MCKGVGILPRVHGSALFTRGETQAIVTTTLGTSDDEQEIESLQMVFKKKDLCYITTFLHSLWSETGRIGTGRI